MACCWEALTSEEKTFRVCSSKEGEVQPFIDRQERRFCPAARGELREAGSSSNALGLLGGALIKLQPQGTVTLFYNSFPHFSFIMIFFFMLYAFSSPAVDFYQMPENREVEQTLGISRVCRACS